MTGGFERIRLSALRSVLRLKGAKMEMVLRNRYGNVSYIVVSSLMKFHLVDLFQMAPFLFFIRSGSLSAVNGSKGSEGVPVGLRDISEDLRKYQYRGTRRTQGRLRATQEDFRWVSEALHRLFRGFRKVSGAFHVIHEGFRGISEVLQ